MPYLRFFFFLFVILILWSSCKPVYKTWTPLEVTPTTRNFPSLFFEKKQPFIFNTSFEYKATFLSGLMIVKLVKSETYRIVFTAKTGTKLLDFELTSDNCTIHFINKNLNRKLLLKLLEEDLRLLLDSHWEMEGIEQWVDVVNQHNIFCIKVENIFRYYSYEGKSQQLIQIARGTRYRKKVTVDLMNYQNDFPESITFAHHCIPLTLRLQLIEN